MFGEKKENNIDNNESLLNDILKTDHRKIVENIFDSDNSEDKTVHLKKGGIFKKIIIILIVVLVLSLSGALFTLFNFNKTLDSGKVSMDSSRQIIVNIDSPSGISDSGEINYVISFKNTEKYKMKDIQVVARFPDEFSYVSSDVDPVSVTDKNIKWSFDSLSSGEERIVNLKGSLFGQIGIDSVFSVNMDYSFDSISSSFSSSNSYKIAITKPVIDIVLDREEIFYKDKEISYKIKIKNNSSRAMKNVKVSFNYPDYFNVSSYSDIPYKEYKGEQAFWIFDLNKKTISDDKQEEAIDNTKDDYYEKIIEIKGFVSSDKILDLNFAVNAGIVTDMSNIDAVDKMFSKDDVIRTTTSGLNFSVNPSSAFVLDNNGSQVSIVNVNSPYNLSFKYKKTNKDLSFKDLRLSVEFLGDDIIDSKIVNNLKPKITSSVNNGISNLIVEWNGSNDPSLKDLSDIEKTINLSLNLKKDLLLQYKDGGYFSNVKVNLFGKNANSKDEMLLVDNKVFKLVLDSNFSLKNSVIYPKILKVDVKTDPVEMNLNLSNSYNKLSGVGVYFNLPEGIEYSGDAVLSKSDKFDYDPQTRKVSWVVGSVDQNISNIVGKFYLTFIPNKENIGKYVELTSKMNVVYKDLTINKDFSIDLDSVKTNKKIVK